MKNIQKHYLTCMLFALLSTTCATATEDLTTTVEGGGGHVDGCTQSCTEEQSMCCGTQCVDADTNTQHCGVCNNACNPDEADQCHDGQCRCGVGSPCGNGLICYDGGCRDLQRDRNNCGIRGFACATGESCVAGTCVCANANGVACNAGEACCSLGCSDLSSDANNCGSCGTRCDEFEICENSSCACEHPCPQSTLPGASQQTACCEDGCFDTCTNANNCGSCGNVCGEGVSCLFGVCLGLPGGGGNGGGNPLDGFDPEDILDGLDPENPLDGLNPNNPLEGIEACLPELPGF